MDRLRLGVVVHKANDAAGRGDARRLGDKRVDRRGGALVDDELEGDEVKGGVAKGIASARPRTYSILGRGRGGGDDDASLSAACVLFLFFLCGKVGCWCCCLFPGTAVKRRRVKIYILKKLDTHCSRRSATARK